MAITTLYFDTVGNGLADGTDWANRAPLLTASGTWSSLIRNFDFSGADTLRCLVGTGVYGVQELCSAAIFSNAPTYQNPLFMSACDSSGGVWNPPSSGWKSSEPAWSTNTMPTISGVTNIQLVNFANSRWRGFNFYSNLRTGGSIFSGDTEWCILRNDAEGSSVSVLSNGSTNECHDSVFSISSNSYDAVFTGTFVNNCRFEGNISASGAAERRNYATSVNTPVTLINCTSINSPTAGFAQINTATASKVNMWNCMAVNCGTGIYLTVNPTTAISSLKNSVVANCTVGLNVAGSGRVMIADNRFRNNSTNIIGNGNYQTYGLITESGTDAAEFTNSAVGDYRIKSTSFLWGKNIGAGDESVSASGGGSTTIICRR
jgi:hypothetical protein